MGKQNMDLKNPTDAVMDNTDNQLNINYEDLLLVSSGVDDEGVPVSLATITIDKVVGDDEQYGEKTITLDKAVMNFFYSGGCLVIQADFASDGGYEYARAVAIMQEFLENANDAEYINNHFFGVVVVPMFLAGQVTIVMQDLVYFTGMDLPDNEKRLIMCFNDLESQVVYAGESVDMKEIENSLRAQIERQIARMDDEIAAINKEIEEANNYNPYQQSLKEQFDRMPGEGLHHNGEDEYGYDDDDDDNGKGSGGSSSWMRSASDD